MVTRPERLVLKFADDLTGTPAAAGWTLLTRKDNGKDEASDLAVIDLEMVPELAEQFNLGLITANEKLTKDLTDATTAYDAEVEKNSALQSQVDKLKTDKATLAADLATANATLESVQAELDALKATIWDVRRIDPNKWMSRFGDAAMLAVSAFATTDENAKALLLTLNDRINSRREDPTFLISLDSPNLIGGVKYLFSKGVITQADAARLTADSRRDEQ